MYVFILDTFPYHVNFVDVDASLPPLCPRLLGCGRGGLRPGFKGTAARKCCYQPFFDERINQSIQ